MKESLFKQPFISHFPGDFSWETRQRQTLGKLFSMVKPMIFPKAEIILYNKKLADFLGLKNSDDLTKQLILQENYIENTYATAYSGHQFGNWAGQLGDGRALFLGEISTPNGKSYELQWKGAGATPYSRLGDGRAVLRSSIREYLMSEAMFHLGIATTRALSLSLTGEAVVRDIMYNGNAAAEPGALVVRVAETFLRFGHFEFLAASGHIEELKNLADYTISKYFKSITSQGKEKYLEFFAEVQNQTIHMLVDWFRVGFVHGVMNTDNFSILGQTIDYGPYGMLEEFDLKFTPNTTDLPGRRYAFGNQAQIGLWNLNALANALFPLIEDSDALEQILNQFENQFWNEFDMMMAKKLGLDNYSEKDANLLKEWQIMMIATRLDYTNFFRLLAQFNLENQESFSWEEAIYETLDKEQSQILNNFLKLYLQRIELNKTSNQERIQQMNQTNPAFVLRNYLLFESIEKAEKGDFSLLNELNLALENPYTEPKPNLKAKRPDWANNVPGCSMLSCSS